MQNKYEVLGVVGEGAYGIVYKCRNKETNEFVAIKKFKETNDDLVKKTMKRELKVLQLLKHENIVEFKEAFKRKGNLFLVFEFVEKNLLELLETFPSGLDQKLIKNLIYQLCKSVIYLHEHNIIHRDIKPENLLITNDFQLKLCDFGFARNFNRNKNEHLTDYVATRWYRSPELLISNGAYGPEVDFWAIGCIMGELSDGNPLFPGENETDQLHCIQKVLGNFTEEQNEMFYKNPLYNGSMLLDVQKPETLERRYMGKVPKIGIEFMKKLLEVDPKKRIKGVNVLYDPYFRGVFKKKDISFLKNDISFLKNDISNLEESRNVNEKKKKDFMRSLSNKIIHDNNNVDVNMNRKNDGKKNSNEKNNMNNTTTNINIINYNLINTSINSNNFSLNNFNLQQSNNKNFDIKNFDKNSPKNLNNKFSMFLQKEKNTNENKNKEKIFKKMAMTMTNKMFIKKFNNNNNENNNNNNNNNESLNLSNRQSLENNTSFNFNNNKPNLNFSFFNLIANNPNRTFFKNNNFNFNNNFNKKLDKYNYNINTNFSKFNNNNNNNNFYSMKKKNNHQSILEEVEEITESQINNNEKNNKIFNENELRKSKSLQEFKKMNKAKKIFNKNLSKSPFRNKSNNNNNVYNNNNFYGFSFYNMNFKYKDKTNYVKKNKNYGIFLPSLKRNFMKKN